MSWEMLTSALSVMVKEANIVILYSNLCIQLLKNIKSDIFNLKLSFFSVSLIIILKASVNITRMSFTDFFDIQF